jgi:hypothetical protein
MNNLETTARLIVALGIIIIVLGLVMLVASKLGLFRLPGDIVIRRGNFTFYFPWVTCIVLSVVLSLIFYWFGRR